MEKYKPPRSSYNKELTYTYIYILKCLLLFAVWKITETISNLKMRLILQNRQKVRVLLPNFCWTWDKIYALFLDQLQLPCAKSTDITHLDVLFTIRERSTITYSGTLERLIPRKEATNACLPCPFVKLHIHSLN